MDLQSRESKEYDNDVNYDEAKIAHYDLPKLLVTPEGKKNNLDQRMERNSQTANSITLQ